MNRGLVFLAIGSIIIAAYSFIKLNQQRNRNRIADKKQKKSSKKEEQQNNNALPQVQETKQNAEAPLQSIDRSLYDNDISESHPYKIILKKPDINNDIDHIHYNLLLSLNKSKGYQGVVKIKLSSSKQPMNTRNLYIDSMVSAILFVAVNRKRIPQQQLIYRNHQILIKKQWINKNENEIQIVFANKYAFMGDGLTCYFPLDQFNKYSLKGQVIYVRNGLEKVSRIFPCLNILNSCDVSLEVLHPNGFNTQANNHKIQMKIATKKDYPQYQFLFFANNKSMNNSYRLNNSTISESNSFRSTDQIVKAKSQFSTAKLNTIHDFFLFSSAIVQVRPGVSLLSSTASVSSSTDTVLKDILIRYFTKQHLVKKASSFLNILQSQIVQIFGKIDEYKRKNKAQLKYHGKIDIFFIDDLKAEGDFYSGSILLNQKTIQRGLIDRRLYFLLCRAFVGMGMLIKKQDSLLTLSGLLKLNQLTLQIFSDCSDYIYVKNKQYQNIRNHCMKILKSIEQNKAINKIFLSQQQEQEIDLKYWIMEYYEKQCRYFVKNFDKISINVSSNVKNVLENLDKLSCDDYWTYFIARYPFIQFNVSQVLIKISLKYKGLPTTESQLKYVKDNFIKSKYYIKFFTQKQVQNDLKRFIQLQTHGIQKILPFIKIKQSFLAYIPQKLQGYLYAKQNRLDSKKLYQQFKKYNQANNFHHISALRRQMKRIRLLARDSIQFVRRDINCGLMGWKLLQKLSIFPQDENTYQLVNKLESIKGKQKINKLGDYTQRNVEEEAKRLQILLQQSQK